MHANATIDRTRERQIAHFSVEEPRSLIAVGSLQHERTAWVTTMLTEYLQRASFVVEIGDASRHAMPAPPDYDVIVVGMTLTRVGDHALMRWIETFSDSLCLVASGLIIVGGAQRRERIVSRVSRAGWMPGAITTLPAFEEHADDTERVIADLVEQLTLPFRMDRSAPPTR